MKIGVLDSGVGGLHILHHLQKKVPEHQYLFVADTANFPYSEKPASVVQDSITKIVADYVEQGCELVVLACNTATVIAIDHLRITFPQIPFVGTVPAVKMAHDHLAAGSEVLVLSTKNTATSAYLANLVADYSQKIQFTVVGTTKLVESVESGDTEAAVSELRRIQKLYAPTQFDGIVIGCTHFSALTNQLKTVFGASTQLFEPQEGIAKRVASLTSSAT